MRTQAINAQSALITRNTNNNSNPNFGTCRYVAVPADAQEDSFVKWIGKGVANASAFSLLWDLGKNVVARFVKNVDYVSPKQMLKNIPVVVAAFLLIDGTFKVVDKLFDK